jgi:hypothetical protein
VSIAKVTVFSYLVEYFNPEFLKRISIICINEISISALIEYANSLLYSIPGDVQVREFVEVLRRADALSE